LEKSRNFSPFLPGVTHVPFGYCYRCPYNLTHPACDLQCVKVLEEEYFAKMVPPEDVAAIFVEPIQGEGGYVVPLPDYHTRLKQLCEKYGILYVADEVQSGFGRTGKMFTIEHWGVVPDIMTMAKGISTGYVPLGATSRPFPTGDLGQTEAVRACLAQYDLTAPLAGVQLWQLIGRAQQEPLALEGHPNRGLGS
jgi:4-aminobutyrate aminotransferase